MIVRPKFWILFPMALFALARLPTVDSQSGVVIEAVTKGLEGERAGLQEGDVVRTWSRADRRGEIASPYDLAGIEIEQRPRGLVTVEGFRGTENRTWKLGPNNWGIQSRPVLSEPLLSLHLEARASAKAGKPDDAAERWRSAARKAQAAASPWLSSWLSFQSAELLANGRHWKEADDAYREAIQQSTAAGPEITSQLIVAWAATFERRGEFSNAEDHYQLALQEINKVGAEGLTAASILNRLGNLNQNVGNLAKAGRYHRRALAIREKLVPGSLDFANSLNNLGNVLDQQGASAEAEACYRQSLKIKEQLVPDSLSVANTLGNLGILLRGRGDLVDSEEKQSRALAIREKLAPEGLGVMRSLQSLGEVALARGDLGAAEEYFRRALAIELKSGPEDLDVAATLTGLGNVALAMGKFDQAEESYRHALKIELSLAPEGLDIAMNLDDLGSLAALRKDWTKAGEYYQRALIAKEKLVPGSLAVAETLHNLGVLSLKHGDLDMSEGYHRRALGIREKLTPGSAEHADSLAALGSVLQRKGQSDDAAHLYAQVLAVLDNQTARLGGTEETRSAFRARYAVYYTDYIDLLIAHKKPELAFQVAEHYHARSLLQLLAGARIDVRKGVEPEFLERERSLQESIRSKSDHRIALLTASSTETGVAEAEKEIGALRREYEQVEAQIRTHSPAYAALTQPHPLSSVEAQRLLDDDTVLLEYVLGGGRSHLWAVTPGSVTCYELPQQAEIEALARRLYGFVSTPKGARATQNKASMQREMQHDRTAATLSRLLLGPAAAQLKGKRLLIVADGALQYVPFAVLPSPGQTAGVPLVVEHELVYAPSAAVLAELRREAVGRKPAPKEVAVLADPVFDKEDPRVEADVPKSTHAGDGSSSVLPRNLSRLVADVGLVHLPRLAFSRREADAIIAVTPSGQSKEAVGFDADRATATSTDLAQYRIVHFATHTLSDSQQPELSGLVLSLVDRQGKPQDGFLDLQSIYNLNLPADLVVLSACQTALGKEIKGEGLLGLTRGFMYAGATRVVASLWNADDVSTKELMERFYKAMWLQGLRPAAALRQAQVSMWKQHRWKAPYYWAAFQIQGEWR